MDAPLLSVSDLASAPQNSEIVVTSSARLPDAAADAAFSIVRLDQRRFEGLARLDSLLNDAPGASLFRRNSSLSANPTTQGVSLRAIAPTGAGRALVTLDGAPQNDPFGGWVIWSALAPESISSAQIVRGAGAGPYGAGALTGVIALQERDEGRDALVARATLSERGGARAAVNAQSALGDARLFASAAAEQSDGYIPVRDKRGAADAPLSLNAGSAAIRLTGRIPGAAFSARVSGYEEDRGAGLAGAYSIARGYSASLNLADALAGGRLGWRVQAWVRRSDLYNSSVSVSLDRNAATPASTQYATPATGWGLNAALRSLNGDSSWEAGADIRGAQGQSRENFRNLGAGFTRNRRAGGETLIAGFYAEASRTAGPWLVTAGGRVDYWSQSDGLRLERDIASGATVLSAQPEDEDGLLPSARFGLRRTLQEGYFLRAAAYSSFRAPSLNELHRPFRVGNDITEANPSLRPERLYGADFAIGRETPGAAFSLGAFYNQLQDAVVNVTIGAGPGLVSIPGFIPDTPVSAGGVLRQRQNAGIITAWGLEAEASQSLLKSLNLRQALSYAWAKADGGAAAPQLTGKRPAQAPRLSATVSAVWSPIEQAALELQARYEGARYDDDLNLRNLAPAALLDARAVWRVNRKASVELAAENLIGAHVQTSRTADGVIGYGTPRTVRLSLTLSR